MSVVLDAKILRAIRLLIRITWFGGRKCESMPQCPEKEETDFAEFRRKIRTAEVLSAAMERLLSQLRFNGKVSVVVQNGRVLKSGYEEGYFRQPVT